MKKIKTIFDRNWEGNRKVNQQLAVEFNFEEAVATEKLDGMNIRVTVRQGTIVRVEKRRNPSKKQKQAGITEPWYVDAHEDDPADKWIFDAVQHTDFTAVPDGEWSGEAIGPSIQGNPLQLEQHQVFLFSLADWRKKITLEDAPHTYDALQAYLATQKSAIGNDCLMEGIVWHHPNGTMVKIKRKDFAKAK